ncbi:DUF4434 domain-containing protein [Dyella amyloliquefaciens]|uniref:DUF4434 domain-containing protein n=1 Tax=Dyella amyloliquefaciens TaxID=1770545 RepID=UPI0013EE9EC3|nr:DUF4434 domain-containing protein [Dyella amyloliquefaciens]
MLRWLAGVLLVALPLWTAAATAVIYQPQRRDRDVAAAQWPRLFAEVRKQGFDTLVVQWTQYGDAFANPDEHAWLLQRVRDARAAGLHIVLGLGSDPAFFTVQNQKKGDEMTGYLQSLSRRNAEVAHRWVADLGSDAIAGWYLPMEIDDVRWNDPKARVQLRDYLSTEQRQLDGIAPRPVYVTSFFAGHMAPDSYAALVADVQRSGVRAWVQDGAGTQRLEQGARNLYLAAAGQCEGAHAQGFVYEMFRQTGTDQAFTATALSPADADATLARRAPCGGDSVFFELRYLPVADGVLPR